MTSYKVKRAKSEKTKTSTFLITINSNVTRSSNKKYELVNRRFDKLIETMLEEDKFPYFIKFNKVEPDYSKIKEVESSFVVVPEGPIRKMLHAHIMTKITHNSNIQIDPAKIRTYITKHLKSLEVGDIHVNIKYIRNTQVNLEKYLTKNILNEKDDDEEE